MTLEEFSLSLHLCHLKIEIIGRNFKRLFANNDELWNEIEENKELAETKVQYIEMTTDCLYLMVI